MKKNIIIVVILLATLSTGVIAGRLTMPVKEKVVEKEVEKIVEVESPTTGLAKEYLFKFIEIQEEINDFPYHEEKYLTTAGMRELGSQQYTMWDTLLNEIYAELQNTLPTETMDELTSLQIQWITDRDTKAEAAGKEAEGGTMQPLLVISSKSETTKERCLELIKDYMD